MSIHLVHLMLDEYAFLVIETQQEQEVEKLLQRAVQKHMKNAGKNYVSPLSSIVFAPDVSLSICLSIPNYVCSVTIEPFEGFCNNSPHHMFTILRRCAERMLQPAWFQVKVAITDQRSNL